MNPTIIIIKIVQPVAMKVLGGRFHDKEHEEKKKSNQFNLIIITILIEFSILLFGSFTSTV